MADRQVTLIDHHINNLQSIRNALLAVGATVRVVHDASELDGAGHVLLPGVGAFAQSMDNLRERGFVPAIREHVAAGRPFMGICLGFQVMFDSSDEHGEQRPGGCHEGLGLVHGRVERFRTSLHVPHVGWNGLLTQGDHPLFRGIDSGAHMYFVHSYHPVGVDESVVIGRSDYDYSFVCAVASGSAVGTQFHPEKSGADGLRVLRNFLDWRP